jgi:hypothetical protein
MIGLLRLSMVNLLTLIKQIHKLSIYPKWSYKLISRITFISVIFLSFFNLIFLFVSADLNFKYSKMPANGFIEYESSSIQTVDLAEFENVINMRLSHLANRTNTNVMSSIVISDTLYASTSEFGQVGGYSIDFTDHIEFYVGVHYLQHIEINYFSNNHNGLLLSKELFDQLYPLQNAIQTMYITTDVFGIEFIEVDVVGYFETTQFKSILFDQSDDDANDLTMTIFSDIETYLNLNHKLGIFDEVYPRIIYIMDKDIDSLDSAIINHSFTQPNYRLLKTNQVMDLFSPLITMIQNTLIFFFTVISLLIIFFLFLRFDDLQNVLFINHIFFSSKGKMMIIMFLSNLWISFKQIVIALVLTALGYVITYLISGYWIDLWVIFIGSIMVIIILNLLVIPIYYLRFPKLIHVTHK